MEGQEDFEEVSFRPHPFLYTPLSFASLAHLFSFRFRIPREAVIGTYPSPLPLCAGSHLDSVRCVAFALDELALVSGSDDMTVKFWRLNPRSLDPSYVPSISLLLPP